MFARPTAVKRIIWIRLLSLAVFLSPCFSTEAQKIEFVGKVIDFDTRAPIVGVTVTILSSKKATITDENGRFTFLLDPDDYRFHFTSVEYKSITEFVSFPAKKNITIELKKRNPSELPEATVEAKRRDANVADARMSIINLNLAQIKKTPLLFGEADIIKALTLQSGITTIGEGAGGFSVRGGNADQNLFLLEGAPIFNTSHLLGFYSTVSPEAVQDFTLYKAAIPASYGGRLSSLANLTVKPGNDEQLHYGGSISPISLHLFADGPIQTKKLTFSVDTRIAYPRFLMSLFPGSVSNSNAFFYDGLGKIVYKINPRNQVSLTLYRSYDLFQFPGDTSYTWQSDIVALSGKSELTKKWSLVYSGNISYYSSDINGLQQGYEFRQRNSIQNNEGKAGLGFRPMQNIYMEGGADFIRYKVSPGEITPTHGSQINSASLEKEFGNELAGYYLIRFDIGKAITLEGGIRHSSFSYKGPHTIYQYAEGVPQTKETITDSIKYSKGATIQSYGGWEPRLLLKIGLGEATSVKLSYIKTRQYLQLISNTIAITPVDYWKLSDPSVRPAEADQFAAGIFRNFHNDDIETSVEGFYKTSNNLIDYKNGASLSMNPYIEADLLPAKGKSYGVELNVRKTRGTITGQLAYTWSRSLIADITSFSTEEVNGGSYYPSNYDRPFNLSFTAGVKTGRGWTFGMTFVYTTGRPTTYPDGTYFINNSVVTNYSLRNADRLADYNRLDLSFSHDSRRFVGQKKYTVLNFSLYNVYARKNPYSIYFQRNGAVLGSYELSVLGTIVPSVTLNVYF